jgi:ATP-dependent exoDNAse (exonuclease V) beta subunit
MMNKSEWNPQHKYWGMSPKEIKDLWSQNGKQAADAGTELHFYIECFMNNSSLKKGYTHKDLLENHINQLQKNDNEEEIGIHSTKEWKHFLSFIKKFPSLKPYRTEWKIYHEDWKISGSIDMVYINQEDGTLSIYDWKRVKEIEEINKWNKFSSSPLIPEIPDTNFYHYSLQLNIYKTILEEKYGKKVSNLYLVALHPDNPSYHLVKVPILEEEISKLFSPPSIKKIY